jgi:hypothetical protein
VNLSVIYGGDPTYDGVTLREPEFKAAVAPAFISTDIARVDVLKKLSFLVRTSGSPTATVKESGALPKGVTFTPKSSGTELLSGTPALGSQGSYRITLSASNGSGAVALQHFTLTVVATRPSFTSRSTIRVKVLTKLSFLVTTTGIPTARLTESGRLPKGVRFVTEPNGRALLLGTPASGTQSTYDLKLTANNGVGSVAVQHVTLEVEAA